MVDPDAYAILWKDVLKLKHFYQIYNTLYVQVSVVISTSK